MSEREPSAPGPQTEGRPPSRSLPFHPPAYDAVARVVTRHEENPMSLPSTDICRHGDGPLTCNPTLHDTCRACFEPIKEIHNGVSRVWLHVPKAGQGSGTDICTKTTTTATPGGRLVIESAQARDAYMDALTPEDSK